MGYKYTLKRLSQEDFDEGAETSDVELAETQTEIEATTAEIDNGTGEVEGIEQVITDSETAVEDIEAQQAALETTVEEGEGATKGQAQSAELAVESWCRRLEIEAPKRISLEAYGQTSTRLQATEYQIEGFKDTVKEIIARIRSALKAMWVKAQQIFTVIFNSPEKISKAALALQKKVNDATITNTSGKLTNAAFIRGFNGKTTQNEITALLGAHGKLLDSFNIENLVKLANMVRDHYRSFIGTGEITDEVAKKQNDESEAVWESIFPGNSIFGSINDKDGDHIKFTKDDLFNGKGIGYRMAKGPAHGYAGVDISLFDDTDIKKMPESVPAFNQSEMGVLCVEVINFMKKAEGNNYRKIREASKKVAALTDSFLETMSKDDEKLNDKKLQKERFKAYRKEITTINKSCRQIALYVTASPISASKLILSAVSESLKLGTAKAK